MKPLRDLRVRGEEGLSLIELMIAVFILAVAILALAGVATQSIARVRVARDQQSASDLVSAQMEAARGVDFAVLALDDADASIPSTYDGHAIVKAAGGPLVHKETVSHGNRTYDITRYVTAPPPAADQDPIKRVTIAVAWTDGDTPREVVNSTIVAAADRGLPVPEFDVEPPNAVIAFEDGTGHDPGYDDADAEAPQAECTTHNLLNLGLADSYAVRIENRQNSSAMSAPAGGDLFTDSANKWVARAWLQPGSGVVDLAKTSTYLMRDTESDGSGVWFEGSTVIGPQATGYLTVCYWSTDTSGANVANEQQYLVRVRSQFDESVVETPIHTVTVGADVLRLHLHELDKNHTGNWSGGAHVRKVQNNNYPPMFMDINPATDALVHDMDSTLDGTSTPGLRLRHDVPASAAVWDHTMAASRPLATGTFSVRVATPTITTSDTAALTYTLERVTADGKTVLGSYVSGTRSLTPTGTTGATATFATVTQTWTFAPGASIAGGEVLRLRIGCADESDKSVDCHVDFDNTVNPGYLEVAR